MRTLRPLPILRLALLALLALRLFAAPPEPRRNALVWDATAKRIDAMPGDTSARFEFRVTNRSASAVALTALHTSCGCTVAQLPPLPARPLLLAPAATTTITVTLDLPAKRGEITKIVTVETSLGSQKLQVTADVPAPAGPWAEQPGDPAPELSESRVANTFAALGNPRVIFQGDCATCHVDKGIGKLGRELYVADCGICHEAKHRAALVPDLNVAAGPRDRAYWHTWITEGKPGTMMPPFAATRGGPLTAEQTDSLVAYLLDAFPSNVAKAESLAPPAR